MGRRIFNIYSPLTILLFFSILNFKLIEFSYGLGNLARIKPAFQSSTQDASDAKLAVDSILSITACSLTPQHSGRISWLAVDLKEMYRVNQVCLLNRKIVK